MTGLKAKALVLDFGGVISKTLFETHAATEIALGLPPGTLTWRGPFDPASDPLWQKMQADEITERDYWLTRTHEVGTRVGQTWTGMSDFLIASRGDDPDAIIRPEFLTLLHAARSAGLRTAILSNELDLFYGLDFRQKLGFLSDIDVIHDATYTKILKPDPRAYEGLLTELGLGAQECVFVDDQKRNIDGAERVGLKTVHFDVMNPGESYAQAAMQLGLTGHLDSNERTPL